MVKFPWEGLNGSQKITLEECRGPKDHGKAVVDPEAPLRDKGSHKVLWEDSYGYRWFWEGEEVPEAFGEEALRFLGETEDS